MANRSEIFRSAWAAYRIARNCFYASGDETGTRRFLADLFAKMLRNAWAEARKTYRRPEPITASVAVAAVNLSDAVKAARIAAIRDELMVMEMSDAPTNWSRHRALSIELFELA